MPNRPQGPRVVVVGDIVVDVVLAPSVDMEPGTDVPGRVMLRQGGSATTTARWLARNGGRAALVGAVGRDASGRALIRAIHSDGVASHVVRLADRPTGRVGVFVAPGGERSFVQDRGAALGLAPEHLKKKWFEDVELVHIPAYSLLDHPLGEAGRRAAELGHTAGSLVTVDLSSSAPLMALGRDGAAAVIRGAHPDLLFAAGSEAGALGTGEESLLEFAPAVVLKRGAGGVAVLFRDGLDVTRIEVSAEAIAASDTTGAGDAFDAGFILGWLEARRKGKRVGAALAAGASAGNRLAARHLVEPRRELVLR
jgi:sugar/nucleoside kinase (ribokinase family)